MIIELEDLIIPSFSSVIFIKLFPKNSLWSKLIGVIISITDCSITFVASNLPPSPVSKIKKSALNLLNK